MFSTAEAKLTTISAAPTANRCVVEHSADMLSASCERDRACTIWQGDKYDIRPHMLGASAAIVGVAQAQLTKCIVAKTANCPSLNITQVWFPPAIAIARRSCVHGRKRLLHLFRSSPM